MLQCIRLWQYPQDECIWRKFFSQANSVCAGHCIFKFFCSCIVQSGVVLLLAPHKCSSWHWLFFFIDFHMTVNIGRKAHCRESMQVPVKAVSSVKGFSLLKDVCCIRAFMFSFFILFIIFFPFQHLELQYCTICVMPFYFSCFYVWGRAFRRMCLVMCLGFTEFFYSEEDKCI